MSFAVRKLEMLKRNVEKQESKFYNSAYYVSCYDMKLKKNAEELLKKLDMVKL